jgi:hypothetical protein
MIFHHLRKRLPVPRDLVGARLEVCGNVWLTKLASKRNFKKFVDTGRGIHIDRTCPSYTQSLCDDSHYSRISVCFCS